MTGEATGGYSVYIAYILPTVLTCTMAFLHFLGELVDVPIATLLVEVSVKNIQTLP